MNVRSLVRLSVPILLALCALGAALVVLGGPPVLAQPSAPSALFIYPSATPSCNTTLQACISAANNGDTVLVLAGTYITNQLIINRAITLLGQGANFTKIGALGAQRVISVGANIAAGVTISNLRVFSGNLTSGTEGGAGIFSGVGTPLTILDAELVSNTITGIPESGAGILANAPITLVNVTVANNQALFGAGGGLRAVSTAKIIGARFERNVAYNPGGGLRATGALTLTNVTVISNVVISANQDGGGLAADGGLFMQSSLVQNNVAADQGGGIRATTAVILSSNIISNTGNRGGGIFQTSTSDGLVISNTTFDRNKALAGDGGSIYANGQITLSGSSISKTIVSHSAAMTNGGGLYAAQGLFLLGELEFANNTAQNGEGGALYVVGNIDDNFPISSAKLWSNNASAGNGGAIRILGNIDICFAPKFTNNEAGGGTTADGGAIYADGFVFMCGGPSSGNAARNGGLVYAKGQITFNTHDTVNNTAAVNGGCGYSELKVLYNSADARGCVAGQFGGAAYSPLTVTLGCLGGCLETFSQNRAGKSGGVAFANGVEVFYAQVVSNSAPVDGGALVATTTLIISGSTFISNTAGSAGGAVVSLKGNAFITGTLFASNIVTATNGSGGAIDARGALTVRRSTFLRNSAGSWGGGAISFDPQTVSTTTLRVENSLFAGNTASNSSVGSAIAVANGGMAQLFFNTFANGTTQNSGSAIAVFVASSANIINNIIANHATGIRTNGGGVAAEDFNLYFNNILNTSGGVTSGGNSLNGDPLFKSAASNDYHLSPGSPAIDRASNLGISEDFDGDLRPLHIGFDIGFDEFRPQRLFLPLIMR